MLSVYFKQYERGSLSIPEVNALEHETGRKLLRAGLEERYGLRLPGEELEKQLAAAPDGKPYLKDHLAVFFNITHCDGFAACAFYDAPVGCDAEKPGYYLDVLPRRILSQEESRFFSLHKENEAERDFLFCRFWTLKEAMVKCTGEGMDADVRTVTFRFEGDGLPYGAEGELLPGPVALYEPLAMSAPLQSAECQPRPLPLPVACADSRFHVRQFLMPGGHIVAVCAAGEIPEVEFCRNH